MERLVFWLLVALPPAASLISRFPGAVVLVPVPVVLVPVPIAPALDGACRSLDVTSRFVRELQATALEVPPPSLSNVAEYPEEESPWCLLVRLTLAESRRIVQRNFILGLQVVNSQARSIVQSSISESSDTVNNDQLFSWRMDQIA